MLVKVNTGFKEGRVSKQALLSWLVLAHEKNGFERSIPKIRAANLDPILVLKAKIDEIRASRKIADPT